MKTLRRFHAGRENEEPQMIIVLGRASVGVKRLGFGMVWDWGCKVQGFGGVRGWGPRVRAFNNPQTA